MNSIRKQIILAFCIILSILAGLVITVVFIEFGLISKYKQSNEVIIYEQLLKSNVSLLAEYGYNAFKSNNYGQYDDKLKEVKDTEAILDIKLSNISNDKIKLSYRSIKRSLNTVIQIISDTRLQLEKNITVVGISDVFTDTNNKFEFVKQNINDLLILETENISDTTVSIEKINNNITPIIVLSIILAFLGLLIFAISFARKITKPIITLSDTAKNIIDGNLNIRVDQKLVEGKDELGILSKFFNLMLDNLGEKIKDLESSKILVENKIKEIGENNDKLKNSQKAVLNLLEDIEEEKSGVEKKIVNRTKELVEEQARLLASINSLSFGFLISDMNHNIFVKNNAVKDLFNLDDNDNSISKISDKLGGNINLENQVDECMKGKNTCEIKEIQFGTKILRIVIAPIVVKKEHKDIIGYVLLFEDITEAKVLERSRDEFFAVASHELRTPLTAIRGNTEMILDMYADKIKDKDVKEMLGDVEKSSIRLIGIVNDFLNMSRLEQGKIVLKNIKFDLIQVIERVVVSLEEGAMEKNLKLEFKKDETAPVFVFGDIDKVEEVLINMIGNSLKFTKKGSVIVKVDISNNFAKISVTDTGNGIAIENQSLLFRKFQPAGEQILVRESSESSGLGLYISRLLVSKMGGSIGLEKSVIGEGSVFFFTLPIA